MNKKHISGSTKAMVRTIKGYNKGFDAHEMVASTKHSIGAIPAPPITLLTVKPVTSFANALEIALANNNAFPTRNTGHRPQITVAGAVGSKTSPIARTQSPVIRERPSLAVCRDSATCVKPAAMMGPKAPTTPAP